MKIAYLIQGHTDIPHIERLAARLSSGDEESSVYIHIDGKTDLNIDFAKSLNARCHVLAERVDVWWGAVSSVKASLLLLKSAMLDNNNERFVLLQGADYPIWTNKEIANFFKNNPTREYIRTVNVSHAQTKYLYGKARFPQFFEKKTKFKAVLNRTVRTLNLKLLPATINIDQYAREIHWGCAQWALTRKCVDAIIKTEAASNLVKSFNCRFPADELYFHTLVRHLEPLIHLDLSSAERDIVNLTELRNLCYFEYPSQVRIFTKDDLQYLIEKGYPFCRKTSTAISSELLDILDARNGQQLISGEIL